MKSVANLTLLALALTALILVFPVPERSALPVNSEFGMITGNANGGLKTSLNIGIQIASFPALSELNSNVTGHPGTHSPVYYAFAAILIIGAIVLFYISRRRR